MSSSGNFGFNFESSVGSVDLVTRPINSCEGEYPDCNGVDLYASNAFLVHLTFSKYSLPFVLHAPLLSI